MKRLLTSLISIASSIALLLGLNAQANAATISDATATSTAEIGTTGTNQTPVTVTASLVTVGNAETMIVNLPSGWSFVTTKANNDCTGQVTHDMAGSPRCQALSWGVVLASTSDFTSAIKVSLTFPANVLNVGTGRTFNISFKSDNPQPSETVDTGTAVIAGGASTQTPTPTATSAPTPTPTSTAGTAAALAALPKSSTQPKIRFAASDNGLSSASKKSLKKVAEVAKDGYGVRVTGAAGMQPGVSESAVKALAKKRALEIRDYLIKQGVPKEDIIVKTKIFPIGKVPATLVKVETLS